MFNHAPSRLGLTWFRAYDPGTGRWVSRDPLGEMTDPAGNLYAYVGNEPLNGTDILGLSASPNNAGSSCNPNGPPNIPYNTNVDADEVTEVADLKQACFIIQCLLAQDKEGNWKPTAPPNRPPIVKIQPPSPNQGPPKRQ